MLVLTRKIGEKIIINGDIEVVVLEASKNTVRFGIEAPSSVQVYREEVYNEIQKANKASSCSIPYGTQSKKKFDLASKFKKNGK